MLTAEASTPAPTYRTPAISSRPWMVPSSPQGPCSTGKTTSTSPSVRGGWAGSVTTSTVEVESGASVTLARLPSTSGRWSGPSIRSRSGSPDSRTQRPSVAMPIGTTSYSLGSMAASTLPAVTHEIACSLDLPPKTTATRGLRFSVDSFIGTDPIGPSLSGMKPAPFAVTAGRPAHDPDQPLSEPVTMASTYVAGGEVEYGRYGNPTWAAFEDTLGALEGGRALAFSSGMAAVSTVLDLVGYDALVVAPAHSYTGTLLQLADLESRGRLRTKLVDITDTDAVVAACEDAALVWLESPTNPALELADIARIAEAAHAAGAYAVVDNTFATPLRQQPITQGADLVVPS